MSRKLIFLDVDGTLVDFTMHMPESAREALSIARKLRQVLMCLQMIR